MVNAASKQCWRSLPVKSATSCMSCSAAAFLQGSLVCDLPELINGLSPGQVVDWLVLADYRCDHSRKKLQQSLKCHMLQDFYIDQLYTNSKFIYKCKLDFAKINIIHLYCNDHQPLKQSITNCLILNKITESFKFLKKKPCKLSVYHPMDESFSLIYILIVIL